MVQDDGTTQVAGDHLWSALATAQDPATNGNLNLNWQLAVGAWTANHEKALIAGIVAESGTVSANLQASLTAASTFTRQGRTLSQTRGSFKFAPP